MVKKSDIPELAKTGFDVTKGSSARKVNTVPLLAILVP